MDKFNLDFFVSAIAVFFFVLAIFLLFSPASYLIKVARRAFFGIPLPMPQEDTLSYKLLIIFYRFIGLVSLSGFLLIIVMKFISNGK